MRARTWLVGLSVMALPRTAAACPVCLGDTDAPLAYATTLGVGVMLGVVVVVLAGFGAFVLRLRRLSLSEKVA